MGSGDKNSESHFKVGRLNMSVNSFDFKTEQDDNIRKADPE